MKTLKTLSFALGALVLGASAMSASAADIEAGKALVQKGNCAGSAVVPMGIGAACPAAYITSPTAPDSPPRPAHHAGYLYHALVAYQVHGNPQVGRSNAIMQGQVNANPGVLGKDGKPRPFTRQELKNIAAYLESLPGDLVLKR